MLIEAKGGLVAFLFTKEAPAIPLTTPDTFLIRERSQGIKRTIPEQGVTLNTT